MFEAFMKERALPIREAPIRPFPAAGDRSAWEALSQEDRDNLTAMYEQLRPVPYPMCTATEFLAFVRSGNRKAYEDPYFLRRKKLAASALHVCLTGTETAMDDVIDGLYCILEESSWVISAHNVNPFPGGRAQADYPLPDPDNPYIDLFSAQTAMILSIVCALLPEQLDAVTPMLRRRVAREIERRVLLPFERRDDFWWMGFIRKDLCNWTPWIVSNVLVTAGLLVTDARRLSEITVRACGMLDRWLLCVPEDGGCDEGVGYWNMAGGALLDCLEWLEHAFGLSLWENPKLRAILRFPSLMRLGNGWFVNFADCDARPMLNGERLQTAGERLGDAALIAMGGALRGTPAQQLDDVPHLTRLLARLFHPAGTAAEAEPPRDIFLPELQVRIARRDGWTLCAKGGHNGDSHNHNDVGSFMLYLDGEPELVDMGNMVYTAKTFSDARYTLVNTRSAQHNVPMIGDFEQACGREHAAAQTEYLENGLALDIARAYPEAACAKRIRRKLTLQNGLRLTDEISLSRAQSVTWVFMLRNRPALSEGCARFGGVVLRFDPRLSAQVTEMPIEDERMARSYPGSLWRLALTSAPAMEHRQTFTAERKNACE